MGQRLFSVTEKSLVLLLRTLNIAHSVRHLTQKDASEYKPCRPCTGGLGLCVDVIKLAEVSVPEGDMRGSAFCEAVQVVGVVRSDAVVMDSAHGDGLGPQPVVIAQYVQPAGTHGGVSGVSDVDKMIAC